MANRNRTAGILGELKIVHELTDLGFDKVVTTRSESKRLDDMGVDIMQLPSPLFPLPCYFQSKKALKAPTFDLVEAELDKPLVVIYMKQEKKGSRFFTVGEYAIMKKEFLYKLLQYVPNNSAETDRLKD